MAARQSFRTAWLLVLVCMCMCVVTAALFAKERPLLGVLAMGCAAGAGGLAKYSMPGWRE